MSDRNRDGSRAERRGVSVYLPDRVVPMLPLPLSAGNLFTEPAGRAAGDGGATRYRRHGFVKIAN